MHIKAAAKIILLTGTCLVMPSLVHAQDVATDQQSTSASGDRPSAISENNVIVVTGTQIKGAKIDDVLPVTVVDEELIEAINPA